MLQGEYLHGVLHDKVAPLTTFGPGA